MDYFNLRSTFHSQVQLSVDYSKNPELKRLKFLAPGPKMTVVCDSDDPKAETTTDVSGSYDNSSPSYFHYLNAVAWTD